MHWPPLGPVSACVTNDGKVKALPTEDLPVVGREVPPPPPGDMNPPGVGGLSSTSLMVKLGKLTPPVPGGLASEVGVSVFMMISGWVEVTNKLLLRVFKGAILNRGFLKI